MEQALLQKPFGVNKMGKQVVLFFVSKKESCGIILYDKNTGNEKKRIPFRLKVGKVYYHVLNEEELQQVSYAFYEDNRVVADKYAVSFAGKDSFGEPKAEEDYRALLINNDYDWESDLLPRLSY